MKPYDPARWRDVLHMWGSVVLALLICAIMAGIPYSWLEKC